MISWSYLLEVSFCWILFYGFYIIWLKNETHFRLNRWYLLLTLTGGAVLPFLQLPLIAEGTTPGFVVDLYTGMMTGVQYAEMSVVSESGGMQMIKAVYMTGLMVSAMIFIVGLVRTLLYVRNADLEWKPDHILVRTRGNHTPFSFLNLLFLSSGSSLDQEEESQVIIHELAHIRERHSLDILLTEVFRILFWFNPIVYLYQNSIRNTHEYLADAAVLETTPKARYGRLLLEQSLSGPHLVNHFNKSQLKKRLIMMTRTKSSRMALTKYLLAIPIFSLCIFLFSFNSADYPVFYGHEKASETVLGEDPDEMPRFPGCEGVEGTIKEKEACAVNKLMTFIGENLKYPQDARKAGVQGMVVVSFVVDESGMIKKPKITKSLYPSCDKEILRVVAEMPNWIPGVKDGKPVSAEMKLPVKYKL